MSLLIELEASWFSSSLYVSLSLSLSLTNTHSFVGLTLGLCNSDKFGHVLSILDLAHTEFAPQMT